MYIHLITHFALSCLLWFFKHYENWLIFTIYSLAQVLGASWYLLSIGRQNSCWRQECFYERYSVPACVPNYLDCNSLQQPQRNRWVNATRVISRCDAQSDDSDFNFGMFADAFTSQVASSKFVEKYLYCLWWGLRNLRSGKLDAYFVGLFLWPH